MTDTRTIRVLHLIANLNYGGMERLIFEILRHTARSGVEGHVLTIERAGRFGEGLEAFATLHQAPPMERWSMLRPRRLADAISAIGPDVVHTHSGMWFKAARAARMARVPGVVHTEHGRGRPDPWVARTLDRLASGYTDAVIAVSDPVARLLHDIVRDPERVTVIPNGVDTDAFRPHEDQGLRARLGIAPDAPILGSIGRLEHIKGYDIMIEAFARLRQQWSGGAPPVLVLAGDGRERPALERLAADRGVSAGVHFLGWRDDVDALHGGFSLFTLSSRSEGTSVSLLEAMSAGLCPVVTDVGGNAAVLGPELAHRLVPTENPDALARAWRQALRDGTREADGRLARERVLAHYPLRAMAQAYLTTYRRVLGRA